MLNRSQSGRLDDIAAILHPRPEPPDGLAEDDSLSEAYSALLAEVSEERQAVIAELEKAWLNGDDPLLTALKDARRRKEEVETDIRALIAYGREFVRPRAYPLSLLAEAAGMSLSGVRTAYGDKHVDYTAEVTGAETRKDAEQREKAEGP